MQRNTSQRRAIRLAFDHTDRPLSTEEVLAAAKRYHPSLGIATVYRALKDLVAEDWLRIVKLPAMPPRYELANRPAHHHFYCNTCGRAFEVPCSRVLLDALIPDGFELDTHDLVLYGRCNECELAQVSGRQAVEEASRPSVRFRQPRYVPAER